MSQQAGSLQFDSGNLTNILVILLIVGLGVYVYFELQKIKDRLSEIETRISQTHYERESIIPVSETLNETLNENHEQSLVNEAPEMKQSSENEFIPEPNDEHQEQYKHISVEERRELSEDEIKALMDDEPLSEMSGDLKSEDNKSDASSDVLGVLTSLKKSEEPAESLNMDEDNIPEEIFENIHNAIENITNLSEEAEKKEKEGTQEDDAPNSEKDYTNMTVNQLKNILTELNLPTSGNKTKLIERIQQNKSLKI